MGTKGRLAEGKWGGKKSQKKGRSKDAWHSQKGNSRCPSEKYGLAV